MSDRDPQSAWLDAWASTQRDLWQKFLSGQGAAAPQAAPGAAQFMQFFGQQLPESSQDVTRKMMEFGEGYLGVAREFWKLVDSTGGSGGAGKEQKLQRDLEALQSSFTQGFAKLYGGGPLGADMLGAWQKMAGPAAAGGGASMPAWPGLPALGITRERQEAMERLGQAALRYQQALGRYGELLGKVSADAVERLTRRISRISRPDEQIGSFRAMYDLWVECGEEAFAAAAHGAEFAKAQSEVNDALMSLKSEQQKQVEDWARALDLPTRTEMNTLLKRVNTLRRRLREVEEELESGRRKRGK
jgi:class III poly(R)-hydroxyalkanoic acid synthase PhaE subunit